MATETTEVSQVENMSLDQLLGTPGAASVLLPENKGNAQKPNMFSREVNAGASFIETPNDSAQADEEEEEESEGTASAAKALLNQPGAGEEEEQEGTEKAGTAKPADATKVNKAAMINSIQSMIDKGTMIGFKDEKPLKDYTIADMTELIEANLAHREAKVKEEFPREFFDSLPSEMQYAVEYLSKGGSDYKGLFRALAGVEEVKQLDTKNPAHHELIVRNYLRASNFGNEDEISEEVEAWKDRGELEAKANKFKPKLDKMQEEQVANQLQHQEQIQKQRVQAARAYGESVYKTLEPAELNGIKLDKKTQTMLYAGLTQPNYPSITGQNTNLLGHLLEKYQYTKEANHSLIAEALYLLADPEGYRSKVRELGKKTATEKTVRELKIEQSSGKNGLGTFEEGEDQKKNSKPGLNRMQNFFQRTNK